MQKSKPPGKKVTLSAAVVWSAATAIWLVRLILGLCWNEAELSFQLPFLTVLATVLFAANAILNWRRFVNYTETNQ